MEMSQDFTLYRTSQAQSPGTPTGDEAVYNDPNDVISDPQLTAADKRAVLASWISDARAVENAPTLRQLDSGVVVDLAAIRQALVSLDHAAQLSPGDREDSPNMHRNLSPALRWLSRTFSRSRSSDNDDPSPAQAGVGVPFRRKCIAANGGRSEGPPVLVPTAA
jgi:hypothetical protein